MRKIGIFLLLVQNLLAQNPNLKELDVSIQSAHYDFQLTGNSSEYGNDENNMERLHVVYVWVIIKGFDLDNPIDFNNFSLVETEFQVRRRPINAGFKNYYIKQMDLLDFKGQDNFLKYTQDGIKDYDHYMRSKQPWKKLIVQQERFYLLRLPPEKNKNKEFVINFAVKNKNSGTFSIYYKDKLLKTFFMKRGDYPKF